MGEFVPEQRHLRLEIFVRIPVDNALASRHRRSGRDVMLKYFEFAIGPALVRFSGLTDARDVPSDGPRRRRPGEIKAVVEPEIGVKGDEVEAVTGGRQHLAQQIPFLGDDRKMERFEKRGRQPGKAGVVAEIEPAFRDGGRHDRRWIGGVEFIGGEIGGVEQHGDLGVAFQPG